MTNILIVSARFYDDVSDRLEAGTEAYLDSQNVTHETIILPGALEIPPAIAIAEKSGNFDGFIALGCVIRGETSHYELVCNESARGITDLGIQQGLCIGNAVLTVENREQALARTEPGNHKGEHAAIACLKLIELKAHYAND